MSFTVICGHQNTAYSQRMLALWIVLAFQYLLIHEVFPLGPILSFTYLQIFLSSLPTNPFTLTSNLFNKLYK